MPNLTAAERLETAMLWLQHAAENVGMFRPQLNASHLLAVEAAKREIRALFAAATADPPPSR